MNAWLSHHETIKNLLDCISAAITLGALAQALPATASLLTIIWTSIRIYSWFRDSKKNLGD